MKILTKQYPPNWLMIKIALPNIEKYKPIFAYGDTIYNPFERTITKDMEVHESVHTRQQGDTISEWWDKYLLDPSFRLEQEVEAYSVQYVFFKENANNGRLSKWLKSKIAEALSGESYGNLISYNAAESRINKLAKTMIL